MGEGLEVTSPLDRLGERCAKTWPAIVKARQRTDEYFRKLGVLQEFISSNTSIVVFGSFARRELTSGSDVDWSLLIDGPSAPEHFRIAQEIQNVFVDLGLQRPGATETFGGLASSHELIHHIGGIHDLNQNMTRRILLLLESRAMSESIVHERVVRGILNRYISEGVSISWYERIPGQPIALVPRFLLNDIVRFWRTMTVDYAAKHWEQSAKKWALRNFKLRMSRKLLFISGLLRCLNFALSNPDNLEDAGSELVTQELSDFFLEQMNLTPLDVLSLELMKAPDETVFKVMDSYDRFLEILDDEELRKKLEGLRPYEVTTNALFQEVRQLSHKFQDGLTEMFYGEGSRLRDLMIKYGVF